MDVDRFRAHLQECDALGSLTGDAYVSCLPSLTAAAALYRGDFLMGFSLPDSSSFDDWQLFEQEALRHDLTRILGLLVDEHGAEIRAWLTEESGD